MIASLVTSSRTQERNGVRLQRYTSFYQALRPNLDLSVFQSSKYRMFFSLRQSCIILPNSRIFSDISANPTNVHRALFNYLYCHLYPDLAYNFTRQSMYLLKSLCETFSRNFLKANLLSDLLLWHKGKKKEMQRKAVLSRVYASCTANRRYMWLFIIFICFSICS